VFDLLFFFFAKRRFNHALYPKERGFDALKDYVERRWEKGLNFIIYDLLLG